MEFPQVKRSDADALVHFLTAGEWPFHVVPKVDPDDVRARLASGAYDDAFWVVDGTRRSAWSACSTWTTALRCSTSASRARHAAAASGPRPSAG